MMLWLACTFLLTSLHWFVFVFRFRSWHNHRLVPVELVLKWPFTLYIFTFFSPKFQSPNLWPLQAACLTIQSSIFEIIWKTWLIHIKAVKELTIKELTTGNVFMSFNAKCLLDTMPVKVFKDTEALINTPTLDLTFIEWLCTSLFKLLIEVD